MKSEQTRIFISMLLLLILTTMGTLLVSALALTDMRQQQDMHSQNELALAAIELSQRSSLTAEEIMRVLSIGGQRIVPLEQSVFAEEAASGRVVFDAQCGQTVFLLMGRLCAVRVIGSPLVVRFTVLYIVLTAVVSVCILLCVMRFTAKWLGKPVERLGEAARRLAEGDLTVRVPEQRHMSAQMRTLTKDFNAMVKALESVEYLRRDFTSSVSHEIKMPVATISAYAQLLLDAPPEKQREYAQAVAAESRRLSGLSDSLLRLTRLESRSTPPKLSRYRVGEQLREICASLILAMEDKHIELTADIPDALGEADADLMAQVFSNLLDNAIKFTPKGGQIDVKLRRTPQQLLVCIEDTGCGMDEETQKHIFEKFYQADISHGTQGVGLGLALVRRIVQLHGGEMTVDSAKGQGSTFTVYIPQRG